MTALPYTLLKHIFEGHPFVAPSLWLCYFDAKGREIGPREPLPAGSVDMPSRGNIVFPPASQDRLGVASLAVMDTPEGEGNVYCETFGWPKGQEALVDILAGESATTRLML